MWQGTVNSTSTSVTWPSKTHFSQLFSLLLTSIYLPILSLFILSLLTGSPLYLTFLFTMNCYLWPPYFGPNKPNHSRFGTTARQKPLAGCSKVFGPPTTLINSATSSMDTWCSTTGLQALLTLLPMTNSFSTSYFLIFWFIFIFFLFHKKPIPTNAPLSQTY